MLRGYRGIFAAIAGLGIIVLALGVGAYFGALYSPDKKQYHAVAGNQSSTADYSGPSQSLPDVAGIPGPAERAIANPPPTSGEDHEKRDLAAQESMSVWGFWMMIVAAFSAGITTVGTIFLYKQITLTREAVTDTGNATKAMLEANEIARIAQRPWLQIEAVITKAEATATGMLLRYETRVTNVGKMVAERCSVRGGIIERDSSPNGKAAIERHKAEAERIAKITKLSPQMPYPILPGETKTQASQLEIYGDIPVYKLKDGTERTPHIAFVCVRYHVPGETEMRVTDRGFSIDYDPEKGDPFALRGIPVPLPDDLSHDTVVLRSGGHNWTT